MNYHHRAEIGEKYSGQAFMNYLIRVLHCPLLPCRNLSPRTPTLLPSPTPKSCLQSRLKGHPIVAVRPSPRLIQVSLTRENEWLLSGGEKRILCVGWDGCLGFPT